jgi:septal ring factor EnvC (AmiA/AmiB activator)
VFGCFLMLLAPTAPAQSPTPADALRQAQQERLAAERRATALDRQAAAATDEAERARAAAAAIAARIQAAEQDTAVAQARIAIIERLRARQRARLAEKQGPIIRLAAALQTMARRPPALALVQPGSIDDVVHIRALMAAQLPLIRQRTAGLRAEVARGAALRQRADAAIVALRDGQARLRSERAALATLEARNRIRSQALVNASLHESDRALALAEEARDITDLMGRLGEQAAIRDRLAALPGPLPRPPIPGQARTPEDAAPARATGSLAWRLPVGGSVVTGFGEVSDAGVRARGLTIATRTGAQVVAPAAGRVAFAGAYRGYGRIIIIEHDSGYTSLITGLADLDAGVGDQLLQGSPIGRAGDGSPRITVELRRGGVAVPMPALAQAG